jgi:hypothetical protein
MISGADRRNAATVRLGRQPKHIQQCGPRFEGAGKLQQLELQLNVGRDTERLVQLGTAQRMHRGAHHAPGELPGSLMYLLQRERRSHIAECYDITLLRRASHLSSLAA